MDLNELQKQIIYMNYRDDIWLFGLVNIDFVIYDFD